MGTVNGMRGFGIVLAVFAPVLLLGCKNRTSPPAVVRVPPSTIRNCVRWIECQEREANYALVVDVAIRDCFDFSRRVIPIRERATDEDSVLVKSLVFQNADGISQDGTGFGWGGGVSFRSADANGAVISISYYWTTSKGASGSIGTEMSVPLDGNLDKSLSDEVRVKIHWRQPWPAPTADRVPFLIKELGGPDSSQALWQLVEIGGPSIASLLTALRDENEGRRGNALWALGHIAARTQSETASAAVLDALKGPDRAMRQEAAHLCLWIHSDGAALALRDALKDEDKSVRETAQWVLDEKAEKTAHSTSAPSSGPVGQD